MCSKAIQLCTLIKFHFSISLEFLVLEIDINRDYNIVVSACHHRPGRRTSRHISTLFANRLGLITLELRLPYRTALSLIIIVRTTRIWFAWPILSVMTRAYRCAWALSHLIEKYGACSYAFIYYNRPGLRTSIYIGLISASKLISASLLRMCWFIGNNVTVRLVATIFNATTCSTYTI